jgi:phosphatidylglycerol:prolipoprotein diacylglycerol transferase
MLGACSSIFFLFHLNKKWQYLINRKLLSEFYIWVYFGAYFGARILSIFIEQYHSNMTTTDVLKEIFSFGPMTFYGGLIGTLIFGFLHCKRNNINFMQILDIGVVSGFFALAVGRIGCFFNGDDYGIPVAETLINSKPWWAVVYSNHPIKIPRVPVQLIESVLVLIGFSLIYKFFFTLKSRFFTGFSGLLMIIYYSILRFCLEFYRGDYRGWVVKDILTPAQFVGLILIFGSSLIIYFQSKVSIKNSKNRNFIN